MISLLFLLLFFQIGSVYSSEIAIKKIKIEGNQRISSSYISNIVKNYVGKKITNTEINEITKKLFTSDYFEDVFINQIKDTLLIKIVEKPILNNFVFVGNEILEAEQLVEIIDYFGHWKQNHVSDTDMLSIISDLLGYEFENEAVEEIANYGVSHSNKLYLIDKEGNVRVVWRGIEWTYASVYHDVKLLL